MGTNDKNTNLKTIEGIVPHTGKEPYSDLRKAVLDLRGMIDKSRWELAGNLWKIHDETIYRHWGYINWDQYVEVEVGTTVRTTRYLISMYGWFVHEIGKEIADDTEREKMIEAVRELGWTKGRCLVGVANVDNVYDWIEKAQNMSSADLENETRKALAAKDGIDPDSVEKMKVFSCGRVTEEQHEIIEQALEMGEEALGSKKKGHIISMICQDYVATNMAQKGDRNRGKYLDRIGAQFGVKLIAVDKETNKVVHGKAVLDKIQK